VDVLFSPSIKWKNLINSSEGRAAKLLLKTQAALFLQTFNEKGR